MDSIDLIKSKSIRGLSTPPCLELKKYDDAINIAEICFPLQKPKNKKTRFAALIVMNESCSAHNWRLLKKVQKEKGSHDVIGEYSRFTRSAVGPPRFEVGAKILILLTMSISHPAANLTIMRTCRCQPGPAELVTYDVQITFTGSNLIVRWEKIKIKSFRVMMINISTVRSPFAIRHSALLSGPWNEENI